MLESLAANILNRFIGAYIENFDNNKLNIGIWSGDVKLRDLRLRKESLDELRLPIDVQFGHLGELTLQIPWSNLKSKPVKIVIDSVYVLATPNDPSKFDPEEQERREQKLKQDKLDQLEMLANSKPMKSDEDERELDQQGIEKNESFVESLLTKITDNVQVTIKNIHVRYEDFDVFTNRPYSVGFTLGELSAVSTDSNWIPNFISSVTLYTHKLLTLDSFAVYWNTETTSISDPDPEVLLTSFKQSLDNRSDSQYILEPVSGLGHVTLNKVGTTESAPHVALKLFFEEFGVNLDGDQYRDFLWTASQYHLYLKTRKFRKLRPKCTVKEDPLKWMQYTAKCILQEVHEKNRKWSWKYFESRRDQRKLYIKLWKEKLEGRQLEDDKLEQFENLEHELSYPDIRFYRSLARREFRKEKATSPSNTLSNQTEKNTSGGWLSMIWGSSQKDSPVEESQDQLELTEEQRKELYDVIDFDEKQAITEAVEIPKDRVTLEVSSVLQKGFFAIKRTQNSNNLCEVVFEGCYSEFFQRPDSFLARFQLDELRVEDGTENTLYKHIVNVKPLGDPELVAHTPEGKREPFFQLAFENNPLDGSADSSLTARMKSMTIFHNPKLIEDVARFFTPPKIHLETVGAIINAAESTLEDFTMQTRIGLQYALEEHKTINLKLNMQSPLIIIPLDPSSWKSPVAVLDAGHISVASDLVDPSKYQEVTDKVSKQYDDNDWKTLKDLMYDKFTLKIQDAQILIGQNIKATISQLHGNSSNVSATILDNLNMNFSLGVSIAQSVISLPRFKIGGDVPRIRVALNNFQYKVIMQLLETAIPDLDNVSEDAETSKENGFTLANNNESTEKFSYEVPDDVSSAGSDEKPMLSTQKLFVFNFTLDTIEVSLLRCDDASTFVSETLIRIIGKKVQLDLFKTSKQLHVDLSLLDINVEDFIEQSGENEFKYLLSSDNFEEHEIVNKRGNLFTLSYDKTQRIVPLNGEQIICFDQDIDLNIADVKFVITRRSILTLLNYALNTFTDVNPPETPADQLRHNDDTEQMLAPETINVRIKMDSIIAVLNDDGIKLATTKLSEADIGIVVFPERLKVSAKIGGFSLLDEVNEGTSRSSVLRNLISFEGNDLAELEYETFDPATNSKEYNATLKLRTGSMKIVFVEGPFNNIIKFLSQFQRMKYIYDNARDAALDQASSIDNSTKILFDVLIKAPTVVLPKAIDIRNDRYETITAFLGELYASNKFVEEGSNVVQLIDLGIRSTKVTSKFYTKNQREQLFEIIDKVELKLHLNYCDEYNKERPICIVKGGLEGSEMNLTELQCRYIMELMDVIPKVFQFDSDYEDEDYEALKNDAENMNKEIRGTNTERVEEEKPNPVEKEVIPPDHTKLDFTFDIAQIALTIYDHTATVTSLEKSSLSQISLNDTHLLFTLKENNDFSSELRTRSFIVEDSREIKDNKFTKILSTAQDSDYQFMASAFSEAGNKSATLAIDSPKTILALDYLVALKSFVDTGFISNPNPALQNVQLTTMSNESSEEESGAVSVDSQDQVLVKQDENEEAFKFTINVVDVSVILLADPSLDTTEAIVFNVEQMLFDSHQTQSLSLRNVGMFLCRMDQFDTNRLRILDNFSTSLTVDDRNSSELNRLTSIKLHIDPLLLRLSVRDIRLAITIVNKAIDLMGQTDNEPDKSTTAPGVQYISFTKEFKRKLSQYAPTIISTISQNSVRSNKVTNKAQVVVRDESLVANFEGLRCVLIGDVYELPVLDMNVKPFNVVAKNWSTDLEAFSNLESFVNIFNYSSSSWEPLIEPWPLGFHVKKSRKLAQGDSDKFVVNISSTDKAEITMTSRSLALLNQVATFLTDDIPLEPRGENSPYRILNHTGYNIKVWIEGSESNRLTSIANGEEVSWVFEDWRTLRESLSVDSMKGFIGIELEDSPYEKLQQVSLQTIGEEIFTLQPARGNFHNRLVVTITLGEDSVKRVVIRSTVKVTNTTQVKISIGLSSDPKSTVPEKSFSINPDETYAIPIDNVLNDSIFVKPEGLDSLFGWSSNSTTWKTLRNETVSFACTEEDGKERANFYFQAYAIVNENYALAKVYPQMEIVISPPLELINLLPYDLSYRIYDKSSKKDWRNFLKQGNSSAVHVVKLDHFLLLSLKPLDCGIDKSDFCIINSPKNSDFKPETRVTTRGTDGQRLHLNLHYSKIHSDYAGVKITIFSPYVVLNRTSEDLFLSEGYNTMKSFVSDTQNDKHRLVKKALPKMFSFDRDNWNSNRATIRLSDSEVSRKIGLDTVGQSVNVDVPCNTRGFEKNLSVTIGEGSGKYWLSKVVTVAPRYIFTNKIESTVILQEYGTGKQLKVSPGSSIPLYNLRTGHKKQLTLGLDDGSTQLSSPFNINDIGEIYLKILKHNNDYVLTKINILLENGSLFVTIIDANGKWPFSMRNFSDSEFIFYQSNPMINEEGILEDPSYRFKPIYYRLPPKSVMPYTWDYPAGSMKELIIRSHNAERHVQLQEIGSLKPMVLPATSTEEKSIVDLNVVADGPTQSLVISNYDASKSMYKLHSKMESSTTVADKFETIDSDNDYFFQLIINLEGAGFSFINNRQQELCYLTLRSLEVRYNESDIYQNLSFKLKWFQLDNQLYGGIYPIVLYPSVLPNSNKDINNHPAWSASISKVKDESHGVTLIKYATILLQEFTLEIDEDFLFAVLDALKVPGKAKVEDKLCDNDLDLPTLDKNVSDSDIYFEALHFQPMQMNLSFVRTEHINAEEVSNSDNALSFFLNILTMAIGNINYAPVRLNALLIENVRVPVPLLLQLIQTHYGQAFLYQVYKILGSADFLGNPVGLFNNLSSGFLDIFYEPYMGFVMNDRPQELGIGLAKGSLSFVKKSVFGLSDSFAKFTGSMAKGLTAATLDTSFQERRRLNQRRNKSKHGFLGFTAGASSLFESVSSGISGLTDAPSQGAATEGASGFFKGIGKGIIGLPTKTAIGFFDLASNVGEGIRSTTTAFDGEGIEKVRLPRFIAQNAPISPYSERDAQGQFWLKSANGGQFFNDKYLTHAVLPGREYVVVISYTHIILVSIADLSVSRSIEMKQIKSILVDSTGLQIKLTDRDSKSEATEMFIPLPEQKTRREVYQKLSIAVQDFNKRCQVIL
ncbi:BA75_01327T0 [Komagataella pastoris]|uniref:Vacuolar protein sorting-associated protein n=1 Tax=Komagataella pastoris TaxID=4922 RepID=A0A1B2J9P1_PICPA|nr:BA75_01327T0 [Komagataella pastoris]